LERIVHKRTPDELGYYQAAEWDRHEGTWLQWPHDRVYAGYQMKLERIWLAMTDALRRHEIVHIIAKDEQHRNHIAHLLDYFGMDLKNIDLRVIPTDDVWARDNGPIFIVNDQGDLAITDWNFNGWGGRFDHPLDAEVSKRMGEQLSLSGKSLTLVPLPIPRNGVYQVANKINWRVATLTDGVHTNYYTANGLVLVPVYGNANDERAKAIIGEQFPGREVIGIDVVSLIEDGGAIGCVTQPQPARRVQQG
jgi:agmatine/peptidylarginine deiminase